MAKSTKSKAKRTGRPPSKKGPGTPTMVRLHKAQIRALDAWIGKQTETVSRPEAIRQLLDRALTPSVLM